MMRLLAVLTLGACFAPFEAPHRPNRTPSGAEAFAPLPEYRAWWDSTSACSGLGGDFARLRFYAVPPTFEGAGGFTCWDGLLLCPGEWHNTHDIYLVRQLVRDRRTVSHEMLHDLADGAPNGSTPFVRCGL